MKFDARTLARSAFARAPRLFDIASGSIRYELMAKLHIVGEPDFQALPTLTTKPDPLILDVGANVGQSIIAIRSVMPNARVICFEPNPRLQPGLRKLIAKHPPARLEPTGLGVDSSEHELFTPVYNTHAMPGLSSFDREAAAGWLGPQSIYGFDPAKLEIISEVASIRTLDSYDLAPDVIKIDVQGMEADVIRGGLETIRKHRPAIIAETVLADSEGYQLLEPLGYRLMEWVGKRLVPATGAKVNQIIVPN